MKMVVCLCFMQRFIIFLFAFSSVHLPIVFPFGLTSYKRERSWTIQYSICEAWLHIYTACHPKAAWLGSGAWLKPSWTLLNCIYCPCSFGEATTIDLFECCLITIFWSRIPYPTTYPWCSIIYIGTFICLYIDGSNSSIAPSVVACFGT